MNNKILIKGFELEIISIEKKSFFGNSFQSAIILNHKNRLQKIEDLNSFEENPSIETMKEEIIKKLGL